MIVAALLNRMRCRLKIEAAVVLIAWVLSSAASVAAELTDRTSQEYESYRAGAEQRFLARQHAPGASSGQITGRPANEDGIISIAGGLIHHWIGAGLVRGVNLQTAIALSQKYDAYPSIYHEIIASRVLEREGETYRLLMRLKEGEAGVTAVLDVRSTVRYVFADNARAFTLSNSDQIREVRRADTPEEVLLPAGRDSGYLWRVNVFTAFVETADGVYIETETLALSRTFPPMLGWMIRPIARRLGRKSVVRSIEEFQAAAVGGTTSPQSVRQTEAAPR